VADLTRLVQAAGSCDECPQNFPKGK
jgi:hypothetical protein